MSMMGNNPMMQNNPFIKLVQMMKGGNNPQSFLQQMAGNNPQMQEVLNMMQSGNKDGLRKMADDMAKAHGTSVEDFAKQMGIDVPR